MSEIKEQFKQEALRVINSYNPEQLKKTPRLCFVAETVFDDDSELRVAKITHYDESQETFVDENDEHLGYAQLVHSPTHLDEVSVAVFAENMRQRLAQKREEGYGGWQACSKEELTDLLTKSLEKGNPVDIANFCAFLFMRSFDYEPNDKS